MKLISKAIVLFVVSESTYAGTIYGVAGIHHLKPYNMNPPTFVQMGSFANANKASDYQRYLRSRTNKAVTMNPLNHRYLVRVGPFYDYEALKQFERRFSDKKLPHHKMKSLPTHHDMNHSSKWFLNTEIGGQQPQWGSSATVNNGSGLTPPYNQDVYTANQSNMSVLLGLQAGRRWSFSHPCFSDFSLGAQYQYFFASNLSGQVIQFSLPQFTNYNDTWQMSSNLILANGKINFIDYNHCSPYFNAGIGAVINTNGHYSEEAYTGVTPRSSPDYANGSTAQFAYILGAGIDYQFSPEFMVNVGYQYSNLGTASSGSGAGSWSSQHLNFGRYQSNAFLFGLTYLFDRDTLGFYTK